MRILKLSIIFIYLCLFVTNSFSMDLERKLEETDNSLKRIEDLLAEAEVWGEDTLHELNRQKESLYRASSSLDETSTVLDKSSIFSYSFRRLTRWLGIGVGGAVGFSFGPIGVPIGAFILGLSGDQLGERLNRIFDEMDEDSLAEFRNRYPRTWNFLLYFTRKQVNI